MCGCALLLFVVSKAPDKVVEIDDDEGDTVRGAAEAMPSGCCVGVPPDGSDGRSKTGAVSGMIVGLSSFSFTAICFAGKTRGDAASFSVSRGDKDDEGIRD